MLERKRHMMNHKKLYRLYREEGLSVPRRPDPRQPDADACATAAEQSLVDGLRGRDFRRLPSAAYPGDQ